MNLLDKFHFKDKNGIKTTMEICDSFSRSKIAEVVGMIPTKVSQLQNDSGFITSVDVPTKTSELQNDSGFITSADVPTKTSELQNDSGFITSSAIPTKTSELQNDSGFITSASVPTKTSQLSNDSGFVNNTYVDNKILTIAIVSGGIIRTDIRTTDGVKYKYDSSQTRTLNITTPYGNGYLGDFRIDIPSNIKPPTNFYDVNITVACSGKLVFGALNYFNKNEIVGWLWAPTYDATSTVSIQFSGYGY